MNNAALMADSGWLVRYRFAVYLAMNGAIFLGSMLGAAVHDVPYGVAIYICLLVPLCTMPLLLLKRLNDQHVLLTLFMAVYFLCFGALDLQNLLLGTDGLQAPRSGLLTAPELAILAGAVAVLIGSVLGVTWGSTRQQRSAAREWPVGSILIVGFAIFVLGTIASLYFQVVIVPTKLGFASAKELASMGPILTFMLMLGQMMLPVGVLILAYGYAKHGGLLWTSLTIVVVATHVVVGFVEDLKITAILGGVLVIMTRIVVTNRLPKGWLVYMLVFVVVAFPVFQAYRTATGERGLDRAQALQQFDRVLDNVMSAQEKAAEGRERTQTFLERSSVKENLDLLFDHVGNDVPYLQGRSLVAIPMAFVPRLVVADKEDLNIGALFGKVIGKSDSGVFISISHLGELYWNFGWVGVIFGMLGLGVVLGFVGAKTNPARGVTLTRVLVLLATVKTLCIGFEGTMPISYVLWMRSLAAIGLMHLIFARATTPSLVVAVAKSTGERQLLQPQAGAAVGASAALSAPRFPNLLR
jgi:hypothetical protein